MMEQRFAYQGRLATAFYFALALFTTSSFAAVVTPVEFTGMLQTPGIGFQTFNKFAHNDPFTTAYYETGSAYFRYYWDQLEPGQGNFNFALVDSHLALARANNQTLDIRIMISSDQSNHTPSYLGQPTVPGSFLIDLENPTVKAAHANLVNAFGNRYDGHPDLGSVDIGSVGYWGEWHSGGISGMPSIAGQKEIVDLYYNAFPNTPLTGLSGAWWQKDGSSNMAKYTADKGRSGWRGDSWGDTTDSIWNQNHHDDTYTPVATENPTAWHNGPVAFEVPSGNIDGPITRAVDDAIAWHGSLLNYGSIPIPYDDLDSEGVQYGVQLDRLASKLGFRLVLREAQFSDDLSISSPNTIQLDWDNIGIAAPYRDHRIAFRLVNSSGQQKAIVTTDQSIQGWLPGTKNVSVDYQIPQGAGLVEGEDYTLEMGLVFHSAIDRLVPISIDGVTADGWYPLSTVTASAGIAGDFDGDGIVGAADYTVWRDNEGSTVALNNDNGLGTPVGQAHYDLWVANFGNSSSGASATAAVPEPNSALLLGIGTAALIVCLRASRRQRWAPCF